MIRADKKEEELRHIWNGGQKIDEIRHLTQIRRKKGLRFWLDCSELGGVEMTHEGERDNNERRFVGSEGRRTAEELN